MNAAACDIVIPMYREREALPALVRALEATCESLPTSTCLFVDDGSDDGTADLARELCASSKLRDARVLRHESNLGLSAALRTGFHAGRGDVVFWLDADLSYSTDVLPELLRRVDRGADVATVSPWHPSGHVEGVSKTRVLLSRGLSRACGFAVRRRSNKVHTWSAMVRAWRRDALARCLPERDGHLGVTESLLRACALGMRIEEVPATLRARVAGRSGLRILPGIVGQLGVLGAAVTGRLDSRDAASRETASQEEGR